MAQREFIPVVLHRVKGIKCDASGCDFHDDTVEMKNYADWLNKPCPKCSANLLTINDLIASMKMAVAIIKTNHWCNRWLPMWLLRRMDARRQNAKTYEVKMNGTGKTKCELVTKDQVPSGYPWLGF